MKSLKETENFGLKKPEENDFYDVNIQNENMDIIESALLDIKSNNTSLTFSDVSVSVENWSEDTTYTDYPYKADITCNGVNENYFSDIVFNIAEALSGIFAPISSTSGNVVTIFASEIPEGSITIPLIRCTRVVSEE